MQGYNSTNNYMLNEIQYIGDYFPYGKVLREYVNGDKERYLTTQHERDNETGLDYRGARYYDSDVARFLSLDPLASDYPSWSDYNYVAGNPIMLIDPTGKSVETSGDDDEERLKKAKAKVAEEKAKVEAAKVKAEIASRRAEANATVLTSNQRSLSGRVEKRKNLVSTINISNNEPIVYDQWGSLKNPVNVQLADAAGYITEIGFAFMGGMSIYTGYIVDYTGEKRWFTGYSGNIGIGLEASGGFFMVLSQGNERFKVSDFEGQGEGWDFTIVGWIGGGVDGTYGDDKYRVYTIQGGVGFNLWWSGSTTTLR